MQDILEKINKEEHSSATAYADDLITLQPINKVKSNLKLITDWCHANYMEMGIAADGTKTAFLVFNLKGGPSGRAIINRGTKQLK